MRMRGGSIIWVFDLGVHGMRVFLGVGCFFLLVHWRVYSCIRKEMGGFVFFFTC
jgi:hypothetical protein